MKNSAPFRLRPNLKTSGARKGERLDRVRRKVWQSIIALTAAWGAKWPPLYAADNGEVSTSTHMQRTLAVLAWRLFPYPAVGNGPYADFAKAVLKKAAVDQTLAERLQTGVRELDSTGRLAWIERSEAQQLQALRNIQGSEFFGVVRTATIEYLFRDGRVWQVLGYEGSAIEFGGYFDRGFDDIDWLPGWQVNP